MTNQQTNQSPLPTDPGELEAERIASDLHYSRYKDSGAKLHDEIAAAVILERRWSQGGAA